MARTIRTPGGAAAYGAPGVWVRPGRDGCTYVAFCGMAPGYKDIGPAAFRIFPDGRQEWLNLERAPRLAVRQEVAEYPDHAEIGWIEKGETSWTFVNIPGYVPALFNGEVPKPIDPQPQPSPQPSGPCVDEGAREYTSAVKKELKGLVSDVSKRIYALETKPAQVGLSREAVWQLARDSVYDDLKNNPNSGIRPAVENIAKGVVPSVVNIDREELKKMVREVLLELINE